ncbi:MAG: hypothetical protein ACP5IT_11875, partial [Thermoproteota archaeon]
EYKDFLKVSLLHRCGEDQRRLIYYIKFIYESKHNEDVMKLLLGLVLLLIVYILLALEIALVGMNLSLLLVFISVLLLISYAFSITFKRKPL